MGRFLHQFTLAVSLPNSVEGTSLAGRKMASFSSTRTLSALQLCMFDTPNSCRCHPRKQFAHSPFRQRWKSCRKRLGRVYRCCGADNRQVRRFVSMDCLGWHVADGTKFLGRQARAFRRLVGLDEVLSFLLGACGRPSE